MKFPSPLSPFSVQFYIVLWRKSVQPGGNGKLLITFFSKQPFRCSSKQGNRSIYVTKINKSVYHLTMNRKTNHISNSFISRSPNDQILSPERKAVRLKREFQANKQRSQANTYAANDVTRVFLFAFPFHSTRNLAVSRSQRYTEGVHTYRGWVLSRW